MQIETTLDWYLSHVRLTKISVWEQVLVVRLGGGVPSDSTGNYTKQQQPVEGSLAKASKTTYEFTLGLS